MNKNKVFYNLPEKIIFCKHCVLSNQRPHSVAEFKHKKNREGAIYLEIDQNGKCDACKMAEWKKDKIDWKKREKELMKLCDQHRRKDGSYDCIVPGSGGKDSSFQSYILKNKFGMNPLTVTWPPIMYTDYGYKNFKSWVRFGWKAKKSVFCIFSSRVLPDFNKQ